MAREIATRCDDRPGLRSAGLIVRFAGELRLAGRRSRAKKRGLEKREPQ